MTTGRAGGGCSARAPSGPDPAWARVAATSNIHMVASNAEPGREGPDGAIYRNRAPDRDVERPCDSRSAWTSGSRSRVGSPGRPHRDQPGSHLRIAMSWLLFLFR